MHSCPPPLLDPFFKSCARCGRSVIRSGCRDRTTSVPRVLLEFWDRRNELHFAISRSCPGRDVPPNFLATPGVTLVEFYLARVGRGLVAWRQKCHGRPLRAPSELLQLGSNPITPELTSKLPCFVLMICPFEHADTTPARVALVQSSTARAFRVMPHLPRLPLVIAHFRSSLGAAVSWSLKPVDPPA